MTPETLAEWREEAGHGSVALDADDVLALLDALDEEQRTRVEITRTLVNPDNCKVWRDDVLVFDGVSLDALAAERAAREEAEQELAHAETCWALETQRATSEKIEKETAEARAVKAEQENALLVERVGWEAHLLERAEKAERERDQLTDQCDHWTNRAKAAEARVAELEAGIARVLQPMNEWDANGDSDEAVGVLAAAIVGLRALTDKGPE